MTEAVGSELEAPFATRRVLKESSSSLLQSLNVLIVRVQSLSVNVLPVSLVSLSECPVSLKYEHWHRVRGGAEKALKTHRASALTAHLIQRGLIVIRPGDREPDRHVGLFKLHHIYLLFSKQ